MLPWFLDELAHAGPEHLDADYVAGYERKAGLDAAAEVERLRALGLNSSSTLVDLGAGTGAVAAAAAPFCHRVVAVDVSPAMLSVLRQKVADRGLTNVECVQAGFLSYTHSGAPADLVYTRHALHQIPDLWKAVALERIAGFLRPSGCLQLRDLFFACELQEVEAVVEAWLAGAGRDASAGWTRAELETHLRDEYSTFTWLFEEMLRRAGFLIQSADYTDSRIYATYTCVRA
jgi:ubiquinone/menaquinone biosynthesis C-methylase UbiE